MKLSPRLSVLAGLIVLFAAVQGLASPITANVYVFTNFDLPGSGNATGAGTNINGISNNGAAVGFGIDNTGVFTSSARNPDGTFTALNAGLNAMAFGINSAGNVVGEQNKAAFFLPLGGSPQRLAIPAGATAAFGINDQNNIVGQNVLGEMSLPDFSLLDPLRPISFGSTLPRGRMSSTRRESTMADSRPVSTWAMMDKTTVSRQESRTPIMVC